MSAVAAGIGAGGSVIGATLGLMGQHFTNETNREIATMNNETMMRMAREARYADQSYNSIGSQMARAMAAGVHPQLLAGAQPTSVGSPGIPQLDTPTLSNPFSGFADLGQNLSSIAMEASRQELQADQLDVARLQNDVEALKVLGQIAGNPNLTGSEFNQLVSAVFGDRYHTSSIKSFIRDDYFVQSLSELVRNSKLENNFKEKSLKWLDTMKQAEFDEIYSRVHLNTAREREAYSNISVNSTVEEVNRSIVSLNRSAKKLNEQQVQNLKQSIENMREQWKSLNWQGELDQKKFAYLQEYVDSEIMKLASEANISQKEARFFIWQNLISSNFKDRIGVQIADDDHLIPKHFYNW